MSSAFFVRANMLIREQHDARNCAHAYTFNTYTYMCICFCVCSKRAIKSCRNMLLVVGSISSSSCVLRLKLIIRAMGSRSQWAKSEKMQVDLGLRQLMSEQAGTDGWICRGCVRKFKLFTYCEKKECQGMGMEGQYVCEVKIVDNWVPPKTP